MELWLVLGMPLLGTFVLAAVGARRYAAEVNVAVSLGTLLAASLLVVRIIRNGPLLMGHEQFFVDPFNVFLVALTAFVGFTTAIFSRPYMRIEEHHGRLNARRLRLYHSMYQLFMSRCCLRCSRTIWACCGLRWKLPRSPLCFWSRCTEPRRAWKQRGSISSSAALVSPRRSSERYFSTLPRERTLGRQGMTALLWTHLNAVKGHLEPTVLALAFVFLLVGYGTKVGLAPLHNWLPDAHAEGPTPVSAVLSGLLLNVALYAVIRCKVLVEGSLGPLLPGAHADGIRVALRGARGILPLAPARHQAPLRLLLHRAHGHHHLRLRHGRAGRQLRRALAHDRALAHEVVDFLHRRARRRRKRARS